MTKIFVYGTLREPEVQMKVIGRMIEGVKDSLLGYKKTTIAINDSTYSIIEEDLNVNEGVDGLVLDINEDDLINLDEYETDTYKRKEVILRSGTMAWVYCK